MKESEETSNEESSATARRALFHEKEGLFSLKYPMRTKSNYVAWAIKIEVYIMAQALGNVIESLGPID